MNLRGGGRMATWWYVTSGNVHCCLHPCFFLFVKGVALLTPINSYGKLVSANSSGVFIHLTVREISQAVKWTNKDMREAHTRVLSNRASENPFRILKQGMELNWGDDMIQGRSDAREFYSRELGSAVRLWGSHIILRNVIRIVFRYFHAR